MRWVFRALLVLGILLLIAPLLHIFHSILAVILWLAGGLLLIGSAVWAVVVVSRADTP